MDSERKHKSSGKHKKHSHRSHKRGRYDDRDKSSSSDRDVDRVKNRDKNKDKDRHRDRDRDNDKDRDRVREKNKDKDGVNKDKPQQQSTSTQQVYRDRAKERREGVSKDFVLDPDDLQLYNPVQQDEIEEVDEDEHRRRMIEESKYLGGDVEHTHLVKGLDFALLQKVKSEQQKKTEKREFSLNDLGSESEGEEFAGIESTKFIHCRTALARRILNLHEEKWPERSELFLPGRMVYVMNLDDDQPVSAIIKSKVDG